MSILTRASRSGRAALAAILAVAALPIVFAFPSGIAHAGPAPVFTMFVPFSEQQVSDALFSIYGPGAPARQDVVTTIDITSAADGSIMYWDHWEDGYEADIANPVQPTTEIWGDANPGNGAPPGVPSDLVDAGTVIFAQNNVALPRNPATILFDGRDKVGSTRGFAMSRAGWDAGLGTLHAGAVAATDLSKYGTQFTFPVGENTGFGAFNYTGVSVMASDDNTVVEFDTNGDGSIDQTNLLDQGETVFIDGAINAGGTVSASKPIQTHLITGRRNSRYEGRWFEIFPEEIRGDEYVAAAGSTSDAERVTIFLQNPGTTSITVAVDAEFTANDTNLVIAPGAVASYDLPNGSGARFSSPGNPFIAVSGTVAVTGRTTWFDWGYSLVPTSSLTPGVVVGWGAGNPDGTQNHSPVWVAPLADTTLYVDVDGDQVADQTIPGVLAYESVRIVDTTDNDMTGARIYTVDGTLISAAWGQDPAGNECCNAYDLGTAVLPSTALVTTKTAQIVVDVNGDGNLNPGDTLEYTIRSVDAGALSLTNIVVQDELPATLTYVPNTTIVSGLPHADDTVGTPFPVDGAGVLIPVLAPGASADVVFRAQLADPFPLFTQSVRNTVLATADQGSANATSILPVVIPNLYIAKNSSASGPLMPGEIFDYVIDVSNIDVGPQSGIDVTDTLPPELTWLSTTVARPIDDPGPGGSDVLDDTFSPAQYNNNPADWTTDWVETDSAGGGAGGGNVLIVSELGSNRVRLRGGSSAITRAFDGAAWDEATLSYDYRPDSIDNGDWVSFQISTTGGTSWIELDRVIGPLTSAAYSTLNYDLTRYLGQDVHLRWVTSPGFSATGDSFYLDNVAVAVNKRVIEVVPGGAPPALYTGGELLTAESLTITVSVQLDAAVDPTTDSITNVASAVSTQNPSAVMSDATDEIARATVGDTVWHDQDGDGVVDGGEPRLSGVTVTLFDSGGSPIATDVTDAGGNYLFVDLDPGDYTVAVTAGVPGGMATTFDFDGGYDETTDVTLGFGEDNTTTNFGYAFPVSLGDRVFSDIGGDGVENGLDFGIDGLTVTITGPSHPGGTTTTTTGGTYGFSNLLPGTYTVDIDTSPLSTAAYSTTGGDSQVVVLTSGNDDLTIDFGYVLPAAIGDTVFHDLNADGDQDAGEPGFVGVDVTITGTGLPVGGLTTATDANGYYLFSNLDAGDFTITVAEGTGDLPVGYDSSTPGGLVQLRSVLDDDIVFDVDFGFYTQATIGDFVFDDVNGNGAWDSGEPGIPGVPITITGPTSTVVVTDAFGGYDVSVDPGTYTVVPDTSGFPPGTVNTFNGASPSVIVGSTDDIDTADFGYTFPATVGDFVWHDLDNDGVQDGGEPGLDGVDLTITGGTLPVGGVTTTTGGGGAYLFSSLDPGTYTITVNTATLPAGYVSSTGGDSVGTIIVVSGTARTDIDFGYRTTADIGDLIFHDLDADGAWDAGEPGLPGVVVTLTGPGIPPGTTDTTDPSGNYLFADLDPGTYTVTVNTATVPAGYTVTAGTDSRSVTLESDTDILTADLGYATTATIGDFVWDDLDGDGAFDVGEPGFDGVTVTLDDGITPITQDTVNGAYDFTGVAPGTYTVTVDAGDLPPGVVNTLGGLSRVVTVVSAQDENDADFAYYQPSTIGDLVWDDLDGDGVFDVGEPGFSGVTLTITGGSLPPGGVTDVTDGDGAYDFTGLAPGAYTVTLTATDLPFGAVNTLGGTSQIATVQSGDDENGVDFGFYVPASIGDFVWDDLNGDGVQDPGEPGIALVTVTLSGPGVAPGTTDTTDAGGLYGFSGLAPGTYTVTVDTADLAVGATSTTGGFVGSGTVTSGNDDLDVDFGVANPITIGDMVFDDLDGDGVHDAGEPGLGSVDVTITGPSHPGGLTVATDGVGFYEFTGLLPGSYTVVVDTGTTPVGYTASSPTSVTAAYASGDDVDTVDFGFTLPADLGDFVFDDLDGDATWDVGEPGLAGVTLELSGPGVAPGTTVTTTGTGLYAFGGLDPGTYTVTITGTPAGYTNTVGGASQVATLESGQTDDTLDFGYYLGASIGDFVFDDLDGDGVFDAGEPGFDAVTVTLDDGVTPITQDTINGAYDFTGLTPGTYTITVDTADLPAGAVNTLGGVSQSFTVASGDDENGADFGYYQPGSIGDYVWNDVDGDGLQDDGPPPSVGFGGVDVTVTGPSFPGGTTVTTDANGAYVVGGLAPGSYSVVVDTATLPAGSMSTTGGFTVGAVSVISGAAVNTVDFGVAIPAGVGDLVFMDNNGNTVFDAGDTVLSGVQLTLTGPGVAPGTTDVTDGSGIYDFSGLAPGTYTVTVDGPLPPGAFSTTGGASMVVTLSSGETDTTVDFGYAQPASIGDTLFHDLDNNGVQDVGDPGIANVDVTLTGPGQPPGGTTIATGPGGAYAFTGLAPGTYTVTVDTADPQMDPTFVSTTGGDADTRTLASNEVIDDVDFGYTAPGSIGDLVFTDANGDGNQAGDSGLSGITVTLTGGTLPPGGVSTTTDGAGGYSFGGVLPGTYTVTVTGGLPAGAFPTTPGGTAQSVTIISGQSDDTIDFGFAQPATIGDFVFDDLDGDGTVDAGEPGFAAVDVTITGPTHPGGFTAPTDGAGGYNFAGLAPGTYTITVDTADLPAGAVNTLGGASRTVTVVSNETVDTADFGYTQPASIGDLIFDDLNGNGSFDPGEPGFDAVTVTLDDGVTPITQDTINGAYDFIGLTPGSYTITVDTGDLPAGVVNTLGGLSRTVNLTSGDDHNTADFGYYQPGSIGDYVWNDVDGDGLQDDGPPPSVGFGGVDVTVTGPSFPGGTTVTTDANGAYVVGGLAPGSYSVAVDTGSLPAGSMSTTGGFTVGAVSVISGAAVNTVDFGVAIPAGVGDLVFMDNNGNTVFDAGDTVLSGVQLTLTGPGVAPGTTDVTDGSGIYDFSGLAPGTYTVTVDGPLPPGAFSTTGGASMVVTLSSGETDTTVDFGYAQPASIGDTLFHDLDNNGVQDVGDPGLANVDITLTGPGQPPGGTTIATGPAGAYAFTGLAPGTYTVTVDTADPQMDPTFVSTTGGDADTRTLASNEVIDDVDFGYTAPGSIGDLVFTDANGDGNQAGDSGLSGITVTLTGGTLPPGGVSTTTDGAGGYSFGGVLPGTYTVTVTGGLPAGAFPTTPGGTAQSVTIISGQSDDTIDFGFAQPATIGDFVFDDLDGDGTVDAGEPGFAAVDVTITGPTHPGGFTAPTDGAGGYNFAGLAPGTYTITVDTADLPAGAVNTLGGASRTVTVVSNETVDTADFGYTQPASIGDLIFDDLNGNGSFDPGEPGFDAVTVTLDDGVTPITQDTINGAYDFIGLTPGSYTITVDTGDLPAGVVNTLGGLSRTVNLTSGDDHNTADFAYYQPSTLGDYIWDDLNGDGVQDPGEPGIALVTVTLSGPGVAPGTTDTTDAGGLYGFSGLAPGTYTVTVDTADLAVGATSTTGGFVGSGTVTSGNDDLDVDFGVANPITIGDMVFDDLDGDGVHDAGEPGLGSVDVTITGPSHPGGLTVATDGVGFYEFTGLLPGSYTVVVDTGTTPVGYTASSPTSVTAAYASGDDVDTVDFGFTLPADLGDFVFDDLDGDATWDVGEPGLAGVTLELSGPGVAPGTTVTTTGTGLYAFGGLDPGTYTVTITGTPAGYTNTVGGASQVATLESGQTDDTLDFGYYLGASIGDFVFDDLDGNGSFDPGEPGFDAVTVTLDDGVSPITQDTINGAYDFTGLTPGTYTITVDTADLPAGAVNTLGGVSQSFTVASGDDENGADFGYYQPGSIGDYVWNDVDGDGLQDDGPPPSVGFGGVDVTVTGPSFPGGTTVTTDANGAYVVGGLAPGSYSVVVDTATLPAGSMSTTGGFTVGAVSVISGAAVNTVDFGVAIPAGVGDLVFMDNNGNTVFDAGDTVLSGVQLTLTGPGVAPGTTDVTDGSGIYDFSGLAPGTYTVTVDGPLPPGAFSTTGGASMVVTLSSGETDTTVDFGYAQPASIGDTLFHDLDNNGVQDVGDPGIANVDVTLTGPGQPPGGTTIATGPGGAYAFTGLAPGTYTVTVDTADPQMDPTFVSTTGGDADTRTLASNEVIDDVDFGYTAPGSIGDLVFTDANGDGNQAGDSGLSGITVTLTGGTLPPGGVSTTTDGAGGYSFGGVLPGTYTVTVTGGLPAGAFPTTPGGTAQSVTIISGQSDDTIDFGFAQPATIGDFVFDDLDGDGTVDAGEPGFAAVDVTITGPTHPGGFTAPTDGAGGYNFAGLAPGTYTITVDTADLPAGAVNTLGGASRTVTVVSNETVDTADFGYTQPASIGDLIFDDLNGNGSFDPGEPGFDAVTVTLDDGVTPITQDTINGAYDFIGLTPGSYTITVDTGDLPAGVVNTLGGLSRTVNLTSGDDHNTADFAYYQPSTLGDYIWDDLNGDGIQNDGPASSVGIGGVDVTITGPTHPGGFTASTDANGGFDFSGLQPGTYTVSAPLVGPLAGSTATTGATTKVFTIVSGTDENAADFGVAFPATIGDTVFDDVNGDGIEDPGDGGFATVDVTIVGPSHPGGLTVQTDGSGIYSFGGLTPGSYTITIDTADLPSGAASTTGGDAQTIVVESGETNNDIDFGYAVPSSIGDQLYVDNNGNGTFDAGDTGIADVDVTITGPGHLGGTTVTTGPTGTYGFTGLEPGSFTVVVDTVDTDFDPSWVSTTGGDSQVVAVTSGDLIDTVDFGYAAPATVGDTIFDDLNGDGVQQLGEPGIAGITVTLTGGDLGGPATTNTNGLGNYTFGGLTPGDYVVTTGVAGFSSTTGGDSQNVSLASGETNNDVDFGYAATAALGDTVFHDLDGDGTQDIGEPGLPGITVTLSGPGVPPGTTDTTDGSGGYGFSGLAPGSYTVAIDTADLPTPAYAATTGGDSQVVILSSGETDNDVDFGYAAPAEIGDLIWDDLDGDGVLDGGEPGFDAVTVTLDDGVAPITQDTVNGGYNFTGVAPGTYTITVDTGDLPAGAVNTFGGASQTITVESTEIVDTVDFGYYQPGSIGDLVFVDDNGNGTFNIGESGLDGVEVTLTGAALGAPLVTTTAFGGAYSFTGLAPGTYTVTLTNGIPAGATSTTGGNAQTLTIASNDDRLDIDFGLAENVTVGDLVWHDFDNDGVQDPGEPGLAGVTLELRDVSNTVIATATSDGVGAYLFTNVAPGMYTVVVDTATVPAGYTASTAESFSITVTSGNDIVNVDVGYATTASMGDLVWDDLDGDGVFDGGELGLDGLTVTLTGGDLGAPLTTVTSGGGAYGFAGLTPGTYTATVTPPTGGTSTTGGDGQTVTIASNEDRLDVDFGYALAATIGDWVWHDIDADGVQDGGELGLGGIAVTLVGPSGPATTTTDGLGNYVFANLLPGSYTVSFDPATVPVGAVSGTQFAPTTAASIVVPIQSGDDVVTADIGFATTGTVSGTIYEDDDADGLQELGESGLVSVTMELVDGGGTVVATVTTDGNGDYSFTGVAPGDYTVRVDESTIPAGFTSTSPATIPVTVVSDQAVTDIDVGYARPATIGDLIWHDLDADGVRDLGEPGLGAVTVELVDGGGTVVATAVTDGAGAYTFTGVDPDAYTVRVDLTSLPTGANTGAAFVATAGVPSTVPVTVRSGEIIDTIDFAFHTTAEIGDFVWHDLDADSAQDGGEPGIVVTVELLDGGTVIASTPTAADGSYTFTGIAPGTYDVRVTGEPAGYSSTTGNDPSTIVLISDQVDDTVDFGFALLTGGSIGNEIWDDLDGDGVRDPGEPGIGGVTVELFSGGVSIDSRVTLGTGSYLFANLPPGTYDVRVDPTTLPVGYAATTAGTDSGNTQTTTILSGEADLDVDFGYTAPATVGDLVWHDLDGDGLRDAGEPGLAGVVLELRDSGGTVVDTATTDASGGYTLTAALAGDYTVTVDPATTPIGVNSGVAMATTTATTFAVTLTSNETRLDLDVGYVTTATIGDTIFDDLNGDGAQDPGEPGLAGVTVVLTDGGGGTTSVVTDGGGIYNFAGTTPGPYSVSVDGATLPTGAVATTTASPVPVTVVSDELIDDVDLGYALPASLAGIVFEDAAGDGSHLGDSGVAGVMVELLDAAGTVIASMPTAADGSFLFTGLLPGGYTVRPTLPGGFVFTIPNTGDDALDSDVLVPAGETATIWVASGENVVDVDAGIVAPATIGDTVWLDLDGDGSQDPDEPGIGGVIVEIRTSGGALVATTTTDASGNYTFTVDPGLYTVSITTPGGYQVDAGGDVQTVLVLSGETDLDVDFALIGAGSIGGEVAYDVSADGTIDPSDPGHEGVTVNAIWDGPDGVAGTPDDVIFTVTTPDGAYVLTDLPPGDYVVEVDPTTLPDGLIEPTVDPDSVIDLTTIVPVSGAPVVGVDFATTGTASLGDNVFIDEDEDGILDPGEPGVGGVTVIATVVTTSGVRTFTTVTDATGFYQFTDLPAGDYVVTLDTTTIPVGLVPSILIRNTTLVINGADDTLDLALVPRVGPEAADDFAETPQNTPVVISVIDNDSIPSGTTVTVSAVTQPPNGTVSINADGTVTYTPDFDFAGTDVFTYTICDLDALSTFGDNAATRIVFCSTANVSITTPPPDPITPETASTPDPTPTTTPTPTPAAASNPTTPTPTPAATTTSLPRTGSDSLPIQTMALLFLAAGLALLLGSRRRPSSTEV